MSGASRRDFLFGLVPGARARRGAALVVGGGARARRVALQLARDGVSRLGVVDPERAEQVAAAVRRGFPSLLVEPYPAWLDADNAPALIEGQALVVDCTGSLEAHRALRAACDAQGIELVSGDAYPV